MRTCSNVTPGNHFTNSVAEAPSSRFSKSAATGIRVPRNTHAPLTRSGSRSTAGQDDQSIMIKNNIICACRARLLLIHAWNRSSLGDYSLLIRISQLYLETTLRAASGGATHE